MDENVMNRNRKLAERMIRALEKRHMAACYAETKEEALARALELIPEGSTVTWGGAMSAKEIGLQDAVRKGVEEGRYTLLDRDAAESPQERMEIMRAGFGADVFIMGTNAISEDGQLVNIDGLGNRVAALIFGPGSVIVLAGMNKVCRSLEDAVSRARNTAAPINAQRFEIGTPCKKYGTCGDCNQPDSICSHIVITRNCMVPQRIKVILIGEDVGF